MQLLQLLFGDKKCPKSNVKGKENTEKKKVNKY